MFDVDDEELQVNNALCEYLQIAGCQCLRTEGCGSATASISGRKRKSRNEAPIVSMPGFTVNIESQQAGSTANSAVKHPWVPLNEDTIDDRMAWVSTIKWMLVR